LSFVGVHLNAGDGTFGAPLEYQVPVGADTATPVDLTGGGALDLLVSWGYKGGPFISRLLNVGHGAFTSVNDPSLDAKNAVLGAVADVNGDGKPDVISVFGDVSVMLNEGQGTFASQVAVGPAGVLAVGDLNGDKRPDFALGSADASQNLTLNIVLNEGNGTFAPPIASPVTISGLAEPSWNSLAMGDLNGDGHPDIAFILAGESSVRVLLNAGDGVTFAAAVPYAVGAGAGSVAIGDLNGDRKLDLAVTRDDGSAGTVSVLLGNGDGTFGGALDYAVQRKPASPVLSDLNGDGRLDVVVANQGSDTVSVLLNTCLP
jgi:hypothetical protein